MLTLRIARPQTPRIIVRGSGATFRPAVMPPRIFVQTPRPPYPPGTSPDQVFESAARVANEAVNAFANLATAPLHTVSWQLAWFIDRFDQALHDGMEAMRLGYRQEANLRGLYDLLMASLRGLPGVVETLIARAYAEGYDSGFADGYEEGWRARDEAMGKYLDMLMKLFGAGGGLIFLAVMLALGAAVLGRSR